MGHGPTDGKPPQNPAGATETLVRREFVAGNMDRESRALTELREGEASFSKAAEIAGMNPWEFAELVAREGVAWVGDDHLEADLRDL